MPDDVALNAAKWIREFLAERNVALDEDRNEDLFADGSLDSFGVVALVVGLEGRFGVHFTEDDFRDPRFSTIDGLAEIVRDAQQRALS